MFLATVSEHIQSQEAALEKLGQLNLEVKRTLAKGKSALAAWRAEYAAVGIPEDSWAHLELVYEGDPISV